MAIKCPRCEFCLEIYFEEEKALGHCCFCDRVICDKCIDEHFTSGENLCDKYDWDVRFHILDIKKHELTVGENLRCLLSIETREPFLKYQDVLWIC